MALPASGTISISMIATELGISATGLSLNDSRCRTLAGVASGSISLSNFYGKSNSVLSPTRTADIYFRTIGTSGQNMWMTGEGLLVSSVKFADGSVGASASAVVFDEGGAHRSAITDLVIRDVSSATATTTATITSSSGKVARIRWTGPTGIAVIPAAPSLTFRQSVTYTEV